MSDLDKLPEWAATRVEPGSNGPDPDRSPHGRRRRPWLPVAVGGSVVLVAAMAALGYWVAGQVADDSPVDASDAAANEVGSEPASTEATGGETAAAGDVDATTTTTTAAVDATTTTAAEEAEEAATDQTGADAGNRNGEIRYAVFDGGQVFLRGRVPSAEVSEAIETRAGLVVGPDNVFNEYEIDPTVPIEVASPLYVEDVVLFEFNSIEIQSAFLPILDLGTLLLVQNPKAEITVVARTDAVGPADVNLEVSRQRGQAVVDYWVRKGIDPSRVSVDARGESDASDDDDPEDAALNRRAEFTISNFLAE
ncbi:MAG: OmpA family protein [Acidimicrobiales bacterium]